MTAPWGRSATEAGPARSVDARTRCAAAGCCLIAVLAGGCGDPLALPDAVRVLGYMPDSIAGLGGVSVANPTAEPAGAATVQVKVLTTGACDVERRDTEVEQVGRHVTIRPFEYRYQCGDRPVRGTIHEILLSFDGPGTVVIDVEGESAAGVVTRRRTLELD